MKQTRIALIAFILAVVAIGFYLTTYIVPEGKQAVITQFGRPVKFVSDPGLNFRMPFVQSVEFLEARLLPWDGAPENMQTRDKKRIYVDCWARWRIVDLETFYTNVRSEQKGQKMLDDIVDSAVRDVIARNNLIDLVRTTNDELEYESDGARSQQNLLSEDGSDPDAASGTGAASGNRRDVVTTGREKIEKEILRVASQDIKQIYGIELVAVHLKRVKYSERVRDNVYERMRSERERVASLFQSEAEEEGNRIKGLTKKELDKIEGDMKQKADEIRGFADAEVIKLTAEAYGRNPEFFEFLQRLEMYKNALKSDTSLIMSTNSDMFRLLKTTDTKAALEAIAEQEAENDSEE